VGWFQSTEIAMIIGVSESIARLGSILNFLIEPFIVEKSNSLYLGLWIGLAVAVVFCVIFVILLNILDKEKDLRLGIIEKRHLSASEKVNLSDIKDFPLSFWLLGINCMVGSILIYCFNSIASNFFQERFEYSSIESGQIVSSIYITSIISCPVIGIIVDRFGRRADWMLGFALLTTGVHLAFMLTPSSNKPAYTILYLFLLGLGNSIDITVIWSSISFLIHPKALGTAYGVAMSLLNLGLGVGPIFIGYLKGATTQDEGYYWVSFFFVMVGVVGVVSAILIHIDDARNGYILQSNHPENRKEIYLSSSSESEKLE
jgi:nitrate/nitrite transporter NarK